MSDTSRHVFEYILVASGKPTHDTLNIMIFEDELERARAISMRYVKNLVKAGYFRFNLYNVDETLVETYNVEIPDPIVTIGV